MNRALPDVSATDQEADLSIGELSERTGVTTATLRVWEARYGFPVPQRRASGHRRYTERDVGRVSDVLSRRDAGSRLDVAIEQALGQEDALASTVPSPSVASAFAQLRRTHPTLMPQRLRKPTLLAMSWAIEDEACARADRAHVFGAFQRQRNFEAARSRWAELARVSASTFVFADFESTSGGAPRQVALSGDSPMLREWTVICDAPELPIALTAWEIPGQLGVRESQRTFETIWTVDATAVREAARVCAGLAHSAGASGADQVVEVLAGPVTGRGLGDPAAVASLFSRMIAYVDTPPHQQQ